MNAWQSLRPCSLLELTFDVLHSVFALEFICVHLRSSVVPLTCYRNEASNARGSSLPDVSCSTFPFRLANRTGTSPQNSQMIWRQAPQGGVRRSTSVTTAMASKPRSPSETALKIATRSAQQVRPSVAFSILHPAKMRPDLARTAAPTRKLEMGAQAFWNACVAAVTNASYSLMYFSLSFPLLGIRSDARQDGAQQRDELAFHSLAGFQYFLVVEHLIENARSHIGDAGDSEDANSHVARGQRFRNRGHADQIGSNRTQITNFRGGFVVWTGESRVHAFGGIYAEFFGCGEREFAIGLRVGLGHIWKARAEAVVVGTDERMNALEIEVIADDDERALGELQIDAAGGVGENGGANAEAAEDAHGKRDLLRGVAFVEMDAALHGGDGDVFDFANHQTAGVADGGGTREAGNFFVGDARGFG